MRKKMFELMAVLVVLALVLGACAPQVVKETVVVEKEVKETVVVTEEKVVKETVVVTEEKVVEKVVTAEPVKLGRDMIGEYEGPEIITDIAQFPTAFNEAPELAELVAKGELPPVEERLPVREDLMVYKPLDEIGTYGGVWRRGFTGPSDQWNAYRISGTDYPLYRDPTFTKVVPNVLKDWQLSEDGSVYDLFLRKGMRWSDGAPFTADDWMFWYEEILNEPAFNYSDRYFTGPDGEQGVMEKIDDYHLRITFGGPYPFFLQVMSTGYGQSHSSGRSGMFQPKHYLKQFHAKYIGEEEANKQAKEAGFEDWVRWFRSKGTWNVNLDLPTVTPWIQVTQMFDPVWIFKRNPYYWQVDTAGNQLPYIDRVEISMATNSEVINLRAIAGEYDMQSQHLDLAKLPIYLQYADQGGYKIYLDPGDYGAEFEFRVNQNYDVDPYIGDLLRDVNFRRALSLGIKREEINETFFLGMGVCGSPIPGPNNPYYPGDEYRTLWHTYEPDKANEMLDALGLDKRDSEGYRVRADNGERLTLMTVTQPGQGTPFTGISEMIRDQWLDIGIDLNVMEMDRVLADEYEKSGEIMLYVWNNDGSDTLFLSNKKVLPTNSGSVIARHWAEWYLTNGESGEEPPAEIKRGLEMLTKGRYAPDEERFKLGQEIWKIHVDQVICIGTAGLCPQFCAVRVVNKNLRNVPARLYNSPRSKHPSIGRPQTMFYAE